MYLQLSYYMEFFLFSPTLFLFFHKKNVISVQISPFCFVFLFFRDTENLKLLSSPALSQGHSSITAKCHQFTKLIFDFLSPLQLPSRPPAPPPPPFSATAYRTLAGTEDNPRIKPWRYVGYANCSSLKAHAWATFFFLSLTCSCIATLLGLVLQSPKEKGYELKG